MKNIKILILCFLIIIISTLSCNEDDSDPITELDEICSIIPGDWNCVIQTDNFNQTNIPEALDTPKAIITFTNTSEEFTRTSGTMMNPSLKLNFYNIDDKEELQSIIESQSIFSWCIPVYYGETVNFYIVTSPCFINNGCFTKESNECIKDLHVALINYFSEYNNELLDDLMN